MPPRPLEQPPPEAPFSEPDAASTSSELDFREVYEAHFRFVWRTLRHLGVREADVMDVAQNTFLVVHRKLCEFEGRSELRTWRWVLRGPVRTLCRSGPGDDSQGRILDTSSGPSKTGYGPAVGRDHYGARTSKLSNSNTAVSSASRSSIATPASP